MIVRRPEDDSTVAARMDWQGHRRYPSSIWPEREEVHRAPASFTVLLGSSVYVARDSQPGASTVWERYIPPIAQRPVAELTADTTRTITTIIRLLPLFFFLISNLPTSQRKPLLPAALDYCAARSCLIRSAARSATAYTTLWMLPTGSTGMTLASTTRRRLVP